MTDTSYLYQYFLEKSPKETKDKPLNKKKIKSPKKQSKTDR